ncbi:hypothetical protein IFR04_014054 [Cadophora malorum]|uniref:Heterokaryon incompatibility domain-containing protein n=1 Tax=Cadophora malorum TaxID=108018 RepID=A0A8H7T092_9HELO|nr:hypothetical protein IFR04_014054 [Cadophora malorum]
MSYIYKRASKVVSWTGPATSGSDVAMTLIGELSQIFDERTSSMDKATAERDNLKTYHHAMNEAKATAQAQVDTSLSDNMEAWVALSNFLDRPYWKRAWIIQEIAVARYIIIQCGHMTVFWPDVVKAVLIWNEAITVKISNDSTLLVCHDSVDTLRVFRQHAYTNTPLRLLDALNQSWACLATDPRDKIFALLGLAYDTANFLPSPSYNRTLTEVSIAMTISAVSSFRSLDIIALLGQGYDEKSDMPSWTPMWTKLGGYRNEFHVKYLHSNAKVPVHDLDAALEPRSGLLPNVTNRSHFDASRGSRPIVQFDGPVATVRSLQIDSIHVLSFHVLSSSLLAAAEIATIDGSSSCKSPSLPNPYGTKAGVFHALWRAFTICGDWSLIRDDEDYLTNLWSPKGREAMQEYAPMVFSWLSHNENFLVHGHTIRQWIEDFKWSYKPLRKILGTKFEHKFNRGIRRTLYGATTRTVVYDINHMLRMDYQLLITAGGYIGWVPNNSQRKDIVCLLSGCSIPVILRERVEQGYYMIGAAYIPGLMDGEGMKDLDDTAWTSFSLY